MFNIMFALMLVHCTASSVYYFGSQSLMCLNGPLFSSTSLGVSAPSRFSYSPWHRLIKYKNDIIEWGGDEYSLTIITHILEDAMSHGNPDQQDEALRP